MELRDQLREILGSACDRISAGGCNREYVELWKHAGPDLQPEVAEVRRRIARLGGIEGR